MPLFRRKPKAPEWARFMTDDEFARFESLVKEALASRGIEHRLDDGVVVTPDGSYGLQNLAQMCHGEEDWAGIIGEHFDRLQRTAEQEIPESWAEAAPMLRARLLHPEAIAEAPLPVAHRPVADLVLALACDFPESVGYVREEDVERWAQPDIWDLALRQVREREEPPTAEAFELGDGTTITARFGDSFFTATHALWVEDGLVAIPHRHAVLTHPLEEIDAVLNAINHLAGMAFRMCEEGPGSISDQLYWKRGDELIHLPVGHKDGGIDFFPPDEFAELLNRLTG